MIVSFQIGRKCDLRGTRKWWTAITTILLTVILFAQSLCPAIKGELLSCEISKLSSKKDFSDANGMPVARGMTDEVRYSLILFRVAWILISLVWLFLVVQFVMAVEECHFFRHILIHFVKFVGI